MMIHLSQVGQVPLSGRFRGGENPLPGSPPTWTSSVSDTMSLLSPTRPGLCISLPYLICIWYHKLLFKSNSSCFSYLTDSCRISLTKIVCIGYGHVLNSWMSLWTFRVDLVFNFSLILELSRKVTGESSPPRCLTVETSRLPSHGTSNFRTPCLLSSYHHHRTCSSSQALRRCSLLAK